MRFRRRCFPHKATSYTVASGTNSDIPTTTYSHHLGKGKREPEFFQKPVYLYFL